MLSRWSWELQWAERFATQGHFCEKPLFPLMEKVYSSLHYVLIRWSRFITFSLWYFWCILHRCNRYSILSWVLITILSFSDRTVLVYSVLQLMHYAVVCIGKDSCIFNGNLKSIDQSWTKRQTGRADSYLIILWITKVGSMADCSCMKKSLWE